jgi:hypothetical protein
LDSRLGLTGRKESEINVTYFFCIVVHLHVLISGAYDKHNLCLLLSNLDRMHTCVTTNTPRCRSLYSCMVCLKWHHVPKHVVRLNIQSCENTQKGLTENTYTRGGPKYFRNLNLPHKRTIVQGSATRYGEPTIF